MRLSEKVYWRLNPFDAEQMALANNLELLLKNSDGFEAATYGTHNTVIFDTIVGTENRVDNDCRYRYFLGFGFGFVNMRLNQTTSAFLT